MTNDQNMEIEIAIAALLLIALTFLATVDMAFVQLSDISLRRVTSGTEEDVRVNTPFLREILENRPRFRFALSAAIQILLIIFSVLAALITLRFFPEDRTTFFLVALTVGLMLSGIFRQFIPRLITLRNPEGVFLTLLPLVRPFYGLFSFVADPFALYFQEKPLEQTQTPNTIEENVATAEDNDGEHLQALIEVGEAEGIIEEDERELIETMVEFGETTTNEVMTPRPDIVALPITASVKAARDLMIESKYSRIPVYREHIENIEGIIYVRDLLNCWAENKDDLPIETLLRPAYFVPETKPIDELLEEMQKAHTQLAIVIDEYGGVAGLVTVEDILEEIVGEIEDEDTEKEEVIEIIEGGGGSFFDVLGSTEIGKIERLFDVEIEDDDFTTIAGLVTSELGYVPTTGENLSFRGFDIEILQADEKKINLLRLKLAVENKAENSENAKAE